jgi:hypothetical protein
VRVTISPSGRQETFLMLDAGKTRRSHSVRTVDHACVSDLTGALCQVVANHDLGAANKRFFAPAQNDRGWGVVDEGSRERTDRSCQISECRQRTRWWSIPTSSRDERAETPSAATAGFVMRRWRWSPACLLRMTGVGWPQSHARCCQMTLCEVLGMNGWRLGAARAGRRRPKPAATHMLTFRSRYGNM